MHMTVNNIMKQTEFIKYHSTIWRFWWLGLVLDSWKKPLHLMVPYCVKFGPSMSNGMTVHRGYKSSNPVASSTRVECSESNQLVWVPYSSNFKNFIQIRQQFSQVILHISKWKITMSKCSAVLQELEWRYLVSRNEKDVTVTLIGFC